VDRLFSLSRKEGTPMRIRPLTAVAVVLVSASLAGAAGAAIVVAAGDAKKIPPPASVRLGMLQSDARIFAFDEQQCVRLDRALPVNITQPGRYDEQKDLTPGRIPAGTLVSSHFVHVDSETGARGNPIFFSGRVATDARVLGIAIFQRALNDTDVLGAPGTEYPKQSRQLNIWVNDFVVLERDARTLRVRLGNHTHSDQIRVITECATTPSSPVAPGIVR
jgi:hypothetical protein